MRPNMETLQNTTLSKATKTVITMQALESRNDLDNLCGNEGRQKFYIFVKRLAREDWERNSEPEAAIRSCYQKILSGYSGYKTNN